MYSICFSLSKKDRNTTFFFSCIQKRDEVDMAEDLDEATQSSDTATDEMDSPISGYRHASFLIQKLDSSTLGISCFISSINFATYFLYYQASKSTAYSILFS